MSTKKNGRTTRVSCTVNCADMSFREFATEPESNIPHTIVLMSYGLSHLPHIAQGQKWGDSDGPAGAITCVHSHRKNLIQVPSKDYEFSCAFKITDRGAEALATALQRNSALRELYLTRNAITDVGAKAIAEALATNTTLAMLGLGKNRITVSGAEALRTVCNRKKGFSLWVD
eukprot:NODE_2804_length_871_cov_582.360294.p2 GENE.NODE_2804_length_871_cov_582.360294~~NODE_2804_length_871_cov_582.360294.p2  ORF type:complete len:173 (-),score=33.57 NODE_2804_length_871_cov_582.360294:75-593(-)